MTQGLVYRVGRRGAALLFLAGLDAVVAWSLFSPAEPLPASTGYARSLAPLWLWGGLWAVTGALCGWSAFRRVDRVGFGAAMGVKVMWSLMYVGGAVTGHIPRGLVSAAVWGAFAAFVLLLSAWPEPPCPHGGGR